MRGHMKTIGFQLITAVLSISLASVAFAQETPTPGVETVTKTTADEAFKALENTKKLLADVAKEAGVYVSESAVGSPRAVQYAKMQTTATSLQGTVEACESAGNYARICLT